MSEVGLLGQRLWQLKIVVGALIAGVMSFVAVALFLAGDHGLGRAAPDTDFERLLLLVLAALGLGLVVAYPILRRTVVTRLRAQWRGGDTPPSEDTILIGQFQTLTIVGAAMAEGFALLGGVIYLLTAHPAALASVGVGLLALLRLFPSVGGFDRFAGDVAGNPQP